MPRTSLKITGASGQGINSIGEIVSKGLKRSGYCVFGYREYPSLIKGGHASYQIDVDSALVRSSEEKVNIVICLNHHGLERNLNDVKDGGLILHQTPDWTFSEEDAAMLAARDIKVMYAPIADILRELKTKPVLGNVILTACVWELLYQNIDDLRQLVSAEFADKPDLLEMNMKCIDAGRELGQQEELKTRRTKLPKAQKKWKDHLLLKGADAMALGAVHAGVRVYAGYPMTPSSPILEAIANMQNETGMAVKQAEDEITAAQFVSGAMFMGTRALTATSGGGFDLMSETLSLNGILENPTVFILAQRPGPATGLPTWTAQGDLLLAVHSGHGEYARCVVAASSSDDSFHLMPDAFNIAEEYQLSVIVLTDKQIAEALYTQEPFDQSKATLKRGIVTKEKERKNLKASDRYDPSAENGISPRWLPGTEADTYVGQGDEHNAAGSVDESARNAIEQMEKRMKKMDALKAALPEPELFGAQEPKLLLVGWGSTKDVVLDAITSKDLAEKGIGYLHFTYVWPLRTEKFELLRKNAARTVLIEGNHQGQLGVLLRSQCAATFHDRILKYDGRPFFFNEMVSAITTQLKSI